MKKEQAIALLPDYLDNKLSKEETMELEKHLQDCEECQQELEFLKALFNAFENEPDAVPSERLRANFEKALEAEKANDVPVVPINSERKKSSWASNLLKVAASIALLVASFQTGRIIQLQQSNTDIAELQHESLQAKQAVMLSLMENQSASKRIQGVSYIEEFPNPDEAIVKALTNRLLYDENDNVRLNAFEALSKFTASETVKTALIAALETEKNPSIQIAIIQALVRIQEKKAIAPMQKLLEQEDTQPFIKKEIELGLPKII